MPVVPFTPQPTKGRAPGPIEIPSQDEPWVLMAAAQMHDEKRLLAETKSDKETPTDG